MINPFEDFKKYPYKKKEIPLDRILQAKLPGYQDYAQKVRFRLVPGVW